MSKIIFTNHKNLDYNSIMQLRFLFSNNVPQEYLDKFYALKSSVEGWKKGTLLHVSNQKVKTSCEKITENLRLYINQLANNNYSIIFQKIKIELENTVEGYDILQDIILKDAIRQDNNLEILAKLTIDLNIFDIFIVRLTEYLKTFEVKTLDNTDNYDQFCIDNTFNTIFKNRYLLLCVYFNLDKINNIETYINNLSDTFEKENDKLVAERYILTYVSCLKKINIHLKQKLPNIHQEYIVKLNGYVNSGKKITSKSTISIMNLLDDFI